MRFQIAIFLTANLTGCLFGAGSCAAGVFTECLSAKVALVVLVVVGTLAQNLLTDITLVILVCVRMLGFIRFCSALGTLVPMVGFIR